MPTAGAATVHRQSLKVKVRLRLCVEIFHKRIHKGILKSKNPQCLDRKIWTWKRENGTMTRSAKTICLIHIDLSCPMKSKIIGVVLESGKHLQQELSYLGFAAKFHRLNFCMPSRQHMALGDLLVPAAHDNSPPNPLAHADLNLDWTIR